MPHGRNRLASRPRNTVNRIDDASSTMARSGPEYSSTIASCTIVSSRWVDGLSTGSRPVSATITTIRATAASRLTGENTCAGSSRVEVTIAPRLVDPTGTAFGGMGASREATIIALVEPTLLVAIFALSVPVGSTNLGAIVTSTLNDPAQVFSPVSLLAAVALIVVIVAETGRLPVDNPSTHLELTMVHEAMVLEYSGPDLAMVELASAMRLTVFLGLLANLFVPWGIATSGSVPVIAMGVLAFVVKVAVLGTALAVGEVFLAKLRLFRVPELLAGSFVLGLLAVAASFFRA